MDRNDARGDELLHAMREEAVVEDDHIGARPGETMRAYCARLVACPKCGSARGVPCKTNSNRNHRERLWGPNGSMMREMELMKAAGVL